MSIAEQAPSHEILPRPADEQVAPRRSQLPQTSTHTVSQYLEIGFLNWKAMFVVVLAIMLLAWGALLTWPRSYESEAKLMLRVGRESVSLDPTATTSQTLMLQKTQEEEIRSALEVLGSRHVAEQVVETLGAGPILNGSLPAEGSTKRTWIQSTSDWAKDQAGNVVGFCLRTSGMRDSLSDRELAVRKLQGVLQIDAPKKSTVITIHAESKTPEMAQAIVSTITEAFLVEHLKVSRTDGSFEFFQQQSEAAVAEVTGIIDRKSKYMQDHKIVSVDANRTILKEQLASIDRDLIIARGELEQTLAEIKDLERKAKLAPEEIVASKQEQTDGTWSGMRQRVYELELREEELATKFTDEYPELTQTREQLLGARKILAQLSSDRVNNSTTPNPVRIRIQEDLQRMQTKVTGLQSIVAEKEKQRDTIYRQSNELLDFEQKLTEMDREIGLKETSLQVLQEKLEEARVIEELQAESISNVSIFQPATFVERPVSPQKRLLAAGAGMLAFCSAIGLALFRETSNTKLRTVDHVESKLDAPVISNVPRIKGKISVVEVGDCRKYDRLQDECKSIISGLLLSNSTLTNGAAKAKTVGVLGCEAGCGASTVAAALALASSKDCGLRTLLVDADVRGRSISATFELNGAPGLAEFVAGDATQQQCVTHMHATGLDLMPSVSLNGNPRFSTDPHGIIHSLAELQRDKDLIIVDLPPASRPDQAVSLAQHLDHVLVVVESDKTDVSTAGRLLRRLSASDANVLGVVLNKTRDPLPRWVRRYITA